MPAAATLADARIFANAQLDLLISTYVINAALRDPDIRQLEVIRRRRDPLTWIQSNLKVALSNQNNGKSADLTLSTKDGEPQELKVIVEAIANAYDSEIVFASSGIRTGEAVLRRRPLPLDPQ